MPGLKALYLLEIKFRCSLSHHFWRKMPSRFDQSLKFLRRVQHRFAYKRGKSRAHERIQTSSLLRLTLSFIAYSRYFACKNTGANLSGALLSWYCSEYFNPPIALKFKVTNHVKSKLSPFKFVRYDVETTFNFQMTLSFIKALMEEQPKGFNVLGECDVPFALPPDARAVFKDKSKLHYRQRRMVHMKLKEALSRYLLKITTSVIYNGL